MSDLLALDDASSLTVLLAVFAVLAVSAGLGKFLSGLRKGLEPSDDEGLKVVLGATLSMFGLLIGFLLTFAISGYNMRMSAEESEAIAVGNAFQHTTLLPTEHAQAHAREMLQGYLTARIQFYETPDEDQRAELRLQSIQMQTRMWTLVSDATKSHPSLVMMSLLDATNQLYVTQQETMASWRQQIPTAAWLVLIIFGVFSCFLIGYDMRGKYRSMVLVVPFVTAVALFMIAEIDVPGKGVIHVTPDNLKDVRVTVAQGGLAP